MKRGRPSNREKLLKKNDNNACVAISISIPQKLLTTIEQNVSGLSRSEKIVKCAQAGYPITTNSEDAIQT